MKKIYLPIIAFSLFFQAFSQNLTESPVKITYNGSGNYTLVERTDLRRYENGKYIGLMSREVRSFIVQTKNPSDPQNTDRYYDGNFYVMEKTQHKAQSVAPGIHDSIPSIFTMADDGQVTMIEDNGFPSFRSFPAFTSEQIKPGDSWTAHAERAVDPLLKGVVTRMPIFVQYTYINKEKYHGEDVYRLKAQWATRYGGQIFDEEGDVELKSAMGSHNANILVSIKTGSPLLVHDSADDTFVYSDGKRINFKGTISLFTEYPPVIDEQEIIPALQRATGLSKTDTQAAAAGKPSSSWLTETPSSVTVQKTDAGLMLTIQNLQFKPNSSELLPGETERLNKIAEVLKKAPKSQFLIEGHTADTGNPKGEQKLSVERSKTIALELAKRGIPAEKFICKGSGSRKPVADNSTPEGKAKNRRVEITILQ